MKIAITWANWFVWSYLTNYFWKKYKIIAFNRQFDKIVWNVQYIKWDLNTKLNRNFKFDIFIHSAADTSYTKKKSIMIKNNVLINKNILNIVNKSNCKHFIYISSSSVYQWLSWCISTRENINKKNLKNSYSLTKFLSEEYIKNNLDKNINLTILRPRAIYWKWDRVLVPNILKNKIFRKLILPWNWKTKTSLTDIYFFINKVNETIINKKYWIYNVSSKIDTYENIYKQLVKEYHLRWIIKIPIFIFKILYFFNKNKYSYIVDNFNNDKILCEK